ncbi:hypothetical protein [Streptoalloteichus hindustanus]|uniref:Uncharacterized protein n=1 Tax=Streptoalloteichus hindustanus TaxID=2017 RepID=A0A1M5CN18_STRHI|nr:hypothetical protein [Streptoalloteichus hindustanus]SHF56007.1 hypothetical protein SAMN05444320_10492 [Streptoalloteichus hindustanus]
MDAQITTLHCEYLATATDPALPERIHRMVRTDLAAALEAELAPVLGADPAVYLIRDLVADVRLDTREPNLPRQWARQLGSAVVAALTRAGRDSDNVVRFPDEAAYLASYLLAHVRGSAGNEWYHRPLARFHRAPVGVVVRQAIPAHDLLPVLAALYRRGALPEVLDAVGSDVLAEVAALSLSTVDRRVESPSILAGPSTTDDALVAVALRVSDACSLWTNGPQPALAATWRRQSSTPPDWRNPDSLTEDVADLLSHLAETGAVRLPPREIPASLRAELEWLNLPLLETRLRERRHAPFRLERSPSAQDDGQRAPSFPHRSGKFRCRPAGTRVPLDPGGLVVGRAPLLAPAGTPSLWSPDAVWEAQWGSVTADLVAIARSGKVDVGELVRVLLGLGIPERWAVALTRGELTWSELARRAIRGPTSRAETSSTTFPFPEPDLLPHVGRSPANEMSRLSGSLDPTGVTDSAIPDVWRRASRTHIPLFGGVSLASDRALSSDGPGPNTPGTDDSVATTTQEKPDPKRENAPIGPEETAVLRALLNLVTAEPGAVELRTRLAAAGPGPYSVLLLRAALATRHPGTTSSASAEDAVTHLMRRWTETLVASARTTYPRTRTAECGEPDSRPRPRQVSGGEATSAEAPVPVAVDRHPHRLAPPELSTRDVLSGQSSAPEGSRHPQPPQPRASEEDKLVAALLSARTSTTADASDSPCAGVLLLLRAVLDLRLPGILTRVGLGHLLTATLLALATRLTGAPPHDPAVVAFAGTPAGDVEELLQPWLDLPEEECVALGDAVVEALVAQHVIDAPDQLDSGAALAEGRLGRFEADRTLGVLAVAVVRAWARWLGRFAGSSVPYLVAHFARRPGRVRLSERELVVELAPGPLDVVVRLAGYDAPLTTVPWLDGRAVTYRLEAA